MNYAMVATGYAVATGDEHPNRDLFWRSQERAQKCGKGVWAEPCRGEARTARSVAAGRHARPAPGASSPG